MRVFCNANSDQSLGERHSRISVVASQVLANVIAWKEVEKKINKWKFNNSNMSVFPRQQQQRKEEENHNHNTK